MLVFCVNFRRRLRETQSEVHFNFPRVKLKKRKELKNFVSLVVQFVELSMHLAGLRVVKDDCLSLL